MRDIRMRWASLLVKAKYALGKCSHGSPLGGAALVALYGMA
jgi:hypothetical protein